MGRTRAEGLRSNRGDSDVPAAFKVSCRWRPRSQRARPNLSRRHASRNATSWRRHAPNMPAVTGFQLCSMQQGPSACLGGHWTVPY